MIFTSASAELKPFRSDGCSLFPDGSIQDRTLWCTCCYDHDLAYWKGGTEEEKQHADEALRQCVLDKTDSRVLSEAMYQGVRFGGLPYFPAWYRWGYGWPYGRGFKALNEEENTQVEHLLKQHRQNTPVNRCP